MCEAASGLGNLAADATVMVAGHPKDWLVGHIYVSVNPELTNVLRNRRILATGDQYHLLPTCSIASDRVDQIDWIAMRCIFR
jgi:hypothetical protein